MIASGNGHTDVVKLLLEQNGIDINAKTVFLSYLDFISMIRNFKVIFGTYFTYLKQRL